MTHFFRYATYISFYDQYVSELAKRPVVEACFQCIKVAHQDYDQSLRDYYIEKAKIDT